MKPCPFCGNADVECVEEFQYTGLHDGGWAWVVRCNYLNGGCGSKSGFRSTKEEAIKLWDTRTEQKLTQGTTFRRN